MARFRRNPRFESQLRTTPRFRAALLGRAEVAKRNAEAIAPPGRPHEGPHYAETIAVESDQDGVRLRANDPFAFLVEFGSVNNPPYAPLRRGVRAAGLRLGDDT